LAEVYLSLTHLYYITGQFDQKLAAASHAAQIGRDVGDSQTVIRAGVLRADSLLHLGELREVRRLLEELIRDLEVEGPSELLAFAGVTLALAYTELGDLDQAILHARQAVDLAEQVGSRSETEHAVLTLGHALFVAGEWNQAKEWYDRAVDPGSSLEWSWGAAYRLLRLGELRLACGDWVEAAGHLHQCIEVAEKRRHLEILPALERALAERDLLEGHPEAAVDRLRRFAMGKVAIELATLPTLAWAYLDCGDDAAAERTVLRAAKQAQSRKLRLTLVEGQHVHARILIHLGRGEEAERVLEKAISRSQSVPYPYAEARCLFERGLVAAQRGDVQGGRDSLQRALSIFRRLGARPYLEQTRRTLSSLDE
jgi:tetratricopeptide (TPR) repeat protein